MLTQEIVFFDGDCGLCHRAVTFLLPRDPDGSRFRFAPLAGTTLEARLSAPERAALPDSLVVFSTSGLWLVKSAAVRQMLWRLGPGWRLLSRLIALTPRPLADAAYDAIAARRKKMFARPTTTCPIVPLAWRERFLP